MLYHGVFLPRPSCKTVMVPLPSPGVASPRSLNPSTQTAGIDRSIPSGGSGPRLSPSRKVMSLERNLREMERGREAYWLRYPATSPVKLRWRALAVRHSFHVLPGESILDLGAGSGLCTMHLATVLRGEASSPRPCSTRISGRPPRAGNSPTRPYLKHIHRLLKPGGQLLFFEANFWNPQVLLKGAVRALRRASDIPRVRWECESTN
jgi:hypothetical protein